MMHIGQNKQMEQGRGGAVRVYKPYTKDYNYDR